MKKWSKAFKCAKSNTTSHVTIWWDSRCGRHFELSLDIHDSTMIRCASAQRIVAMAKGSGDNHGRPKALSALSEKWDEESLNSGAKPRHRSSHDEETVRMSVLSSVSTDREDATQSRSTCPDKLVQKGRQPY